MPKISDEQEFDSVFDVMPSRIDMRNQIILVNVARAITRDLGEQYNLMLLALPAGQPKPSMSDFILDPEGSGATGAVLNQALSDTWKLDSTIHGLQAVWTRKNLTGTVSPANTDLSGVEFYGADKVIDFSSVNFEGADFDGSEFIGACLVTDPTALKVNHCATASTTPANPAPPKPAESSARPARLSPKPPIKN